MPDFDRLPCFVYVDEAQDYFDENIGIILSQARKYQVGMVLAHQYLGQLSNGLQEAFEANSSIKLAGGVSARDARALASQLSADPDMIQRQPKGSFATYIRGLTERAVPMSFPFFVLEKLPRASAERRNAIREYSRSHYAEPLPTSSTNAAENEPESMTKPNLSEPTDPTGLSPEL